MGNTSRGAALTVALATALLVGCSSEDEAPENTSSAETAPPGDYGTPADPSLPNPSAVATDPVPSPGPVEAGTVRITYADWNPEARVVEAGGILPDVVESGGLCTLTLTKESATVTATVDGVPDARSTNCGGLVASGDLSPGTWTAVISYRSARSDATSDPVEVQIP